MAAACKGEPVMTDTPVISWRFRGTSRFDHVISGGLAKGEVAVDANYWILCDEYGLKPIAGGSGDVTSGGQALDGPPKPPPARRRPGLAGAPLEIAFEGTITRDHWTISSARTRIDCGLVKPMLWRSSG